MKKDFDIIDLDFTDALPRVDEEYTKENSDNTKEAIYESDEDYAEEIPTEENKVNVQDKPEKTKKANTKETEPQLNEEKQGSEVFQGEVTVDTIILNGITDAVEGAGAKENNGEFKAVIYDKNSTDRIREEIQQVLEGGVPEENAYMETDGYSKEYYEGGMEEDLLLVTNEESPANDMEYDAEYEEEYYEDEYYEEEGCDGEYYAEDGEYYEDEYVEETDAEYYEDEYAEGTDAEYYEGEYVEETDAEYYEDDFAEESDIEFMDEEALEDEEELEFTDVEELKEKKVASPRKRSRRKKGFLPMLKEFVQSRSVGDWIIGGTGAAVLILAIVTLVFWNSSRTLDTQVASLYDVGYGLSNLGIAGESGLMAVANANSGAISDVVEEEEEEAVLSEIEVTFTSLERDLKIKFINHANNRLVTDLLFEVVLVSESGEEIVFRDEDLDGIIYENDMEPGDYEVTVTEMEGYTFLDYADVVTVKDQIVYEEIDVSQEIKTEAEVDATVEDTAINNAEEEAELDNTPVLTDTVEWVESTRTPLNGSDGYREIDKSSIPEPSYAARNVIEVTNELLAAGNNLELYLEMQTLVRTQSGSTSDNTVSDNTTDDDTTDDDSNSGNNDSGNTDSGNTGGGNTGGDDDNDDDDDEEPTAVTATITISGGGSVSVNNTLTLSASAKADGNSLSGGTYTWSSDKTSVATVDSSGKVTAVAPGTATIRVEYSWLDSANNKKYTGSATVTITVTEAPAAVTVSSVTLSKTSATLSANETLTLSANATMSDGSKVTTASSFVWSSDKTSVATVDNSGKVTAKAEGTATITVTYTDSRGNTKSATCTITVTSNTVSSVSLNKAATTITRGSTETLTATAYMSGGNRITNASEFTWTSDNTSVATVDSSGKITAVATGTARITAAYTDSKGNKKTATCVVTVVANPAEDTSTKLKDSDGNQVYIRNSSGAYVEATYADYYTASAFYIASETEYRYTGWQTINGNVYFYDKNGNKVTGEQIIQGVRYNFTSDGILAMNNNGILGIDVSKWNGTIDWNAVRNSGISYVIIRCGYRGSSTGVLVEDPMFRTNIQGATNAGLKVGVYFFTQAVNEVEAVEEASMVLNLVRGCGISYPIFIDTEKANGRADNLDAATRTAVCRAFCETIRNAGYSAGIYASKYWYYDNLNYNSLSGYNIWLAQYASEPTFNYRYDMWQYTERGTVNGISGYVDMNISYLGY